MQTIVGTRSDDFLAIFSFGCEFFLQKEGKDLHESFPGFAVLVFILF